MSRPASSPKTLRLLSLADAAAVPPETIFAAVRDALIAHAEGRTSVPPPMVLEFPDHAGDCHVKAGHVAGSPHFAVKIASSFASVNNGLIMVVDATDGAPAAVIADEGMLTAWRTAAAGALITHAMTPPEIDEVAVLGTGEQALLQVRWLRKLRAINRVHVWGRRSEAAERLCKAFQSEGIDARPNALEAGASCVITTTAARNPLPAKAFRNAVHVTGIGADMPGKHELPVELFAGAQVVTDDHEQCLDHGDFGNAVRAGVIRADADLAVGAVLRDGAPERSTRSIADLTGIGATDAAVASVVVEWSAR